MKRIWAVVALAAGALAIPTTPAVAQAVTCNGVPATIIGTESDDAITGTAGRDVIATLGGDDDVSGLAGDDLICLGPGNDVVEGGAGNETIFGGPGNDSLIVEAVLDGADRFAGEEGVDTARYGARSVANTISLDGVANDGATGEGDNIQADVENVTGGGGGNRLVGSAVRNVLSGGSGRDTILGAGGDDSLLGGRGNDTIAGQGGDDFVFGQSDNDVFVADSGVDGADFFEGDQGTDTADYSARSGALTIVVDDVANDGAAGEGDDIRRDVENVTGGAGNDRIVVRNLIADSRLIGGPGNDFLDTRDLDIDDVVFGGQGSDGCTIDPGEVCEL